MCTDTPGRPFRTIPIAQKYNIKKNTLKGSPQKLKDGLFLKITISLESNSLYLPINNAYKVMRKNILNIHFYMYLSYHSIMKEKNDF